METTRMVASNGKGDGEPTDCLVSASLQYIVPPLSIQNNLKFVIRGPRQPVEDQV